jgi:deoxyadenosine/deoxycytidine kinase
MNQDIKPKHIVISGNIGAGKTTLSEKLSRHFGWEVNYESTDDNPYLEDFYADMGRWSFNLQVYFLNSRYEQVLKIKNGDKTVIQDRSIYEDAFIFAPNLHEMGLMSARDFQNFYRLFELMNSQIQAPDLLIYLKSSVPTLVKHIQKRGRSYETSMSVNYLELLNQRYEKWIEGYKYGNLLVISSDELDFVQKEDDWKYIINKVSGALNIK